MYCVSPSPEPLDEDIVDAYYQACSDQQGNTATCQEADLIAQFFRFVLEAFSRDHGLRTAFINCPHYLAIILKSLSPAQAPSTSAELLRAINEVSS